MSKDFPFADGVGSSKDVLLPESIEIASFLALAFKRLGGDFEITGEGKRYSWQPEPVFFRMADKPLPQMPDAKPHESFHSEEEWRGALKLVGYFLHRLGNADREFIFTTFASVVTQQSLNE